jgi:hypothetical protein
MKPVQVSGEVDSVGKLHLSNVPLLPVSQKVRVLILDQTDVVAIEQMIELVTGMDAVDQGLLEQLEALDEALWDAQFASSPNVLKKLADDAQRDHAEGRTVPLDFDELRRSGTT